MKNIKPNNTVRNFSQVLFSNSEQYKKLNISNLDIHAFPVSCTAGHGALALFSDNTVRFNLSTHFSPSRLGHGHSLIVLFNSEQFIQQKSLSFSKTDYLSFVNNIKSLGHCEKDFFSVDLHQYNQLLLKYYINTNIFKTNGRVEQITSIISTKFPVYANGLNIILSDKISDSLIERGIFFDKEENFIRIAFPIYISDNQLSEIFKIIDQVI